MLVSIDQLKLSLRIDSSADDTLLKGYSNAAESYIKNAIGYDYDDFYTEERVAPLFETAVIALASSYYTFRTSLSLVQSYPVDVAVESIIGQLRGEYTLFEEEKNANKSS